MRMLLLVCVLSLLASPVLAAPRVPPAELVGLRLGMNDHEVRTRLERIGKLTETQPEGRGRKQIWSLRHKRFETLNLRMTPGFELQWCTAYARRGRLKYSDVGDTTQARKVGRFIWVWNVTGTGAQPSYQVTARGTDPRFASSVALSPPLSVPRDSTSHDTPADSAR